MTAFGEAVNSLIRLQFSGLPDGAVADSSRAAVARRCATVFTRLASTVRKKLRFDGVVVCSVTGFLEVVCFPRQLYVVMFHIVVVGFSWCFWCSCTDVSIWTLSLWFTS